MVKRLTDAGWLVTKDTPHDMAVHPEHPGVKIPIPHHKEINEYLARAILRQAGLQ